LKLSNSDMADLITLRRDLHRHPELSGQEAETANRIASFLAPAKPDQVVRGLGGHGVAAIFEGDAPGPSVMIRCELDGLPIAELSEADHRSTIPGKGHLCGHDGHMAILSGLARLLARRRPARGRVILMFQPAEEDGKGAALVLADPAFEGIKPDFAFALHNMPGLKRGHISLREGFANCASRGMRILLSGKTAHASMPEAGVSPMAAVSDLMPTLTSLGQGGPLNEEYALVTVTHCRIGEPAFGIAPGAAEIWATLRTLTDAQMSALVFAAQQIVTQAAEKYGLGAKMEFDDVFHHCVNQPKAVSYLKQAIEDEGLPARYDDPPMRASEDFGLFGNHAHSAMFLLGAGEDHASLHNPDYDFPDDLIQTGTAVFHRVIRNMLG